MTSIENSESPINSDEERNPSISPSNPQSSLTSDNDIYNSDDKSKTTSESSDGDKDNLEDECGSKSQKITSSEGKQNEKIKENSQDSNLIQNNTNHNDSNISPNENGLKEVKTQKEPQTSEVSHNEEIKSKDTNGTPETSKESHKEEIKYLNGENKSNIASEEYIDGGVKLENVKRPLERKDEFQEAENGCKSHSSVDKSEVEHTHGYQGGYQNGFKSYPTDEGLSPTSQEEKGIGEAHSDKNQGLLVHSDESISCEEKASVVKMDPIGKQEVDKNQISTNEDPLIFSHLKSVSDDDALHIEDKENISTNYRRVENNSIKQVSNPPGKDNRGIEEPIAHIENLGISASRTVSEDEMQELIDIPHADQPNHDAQKLETSVFLGHNSLSLLNSNKKREIISFSFNYDASEFLCTTSCGFRIYQCSPLQLILSMEPPEYANQSIWLFKTFFHSQVYIIVFTSKKNELVICDRTRNKVLKNFRFMREILQIYTSKQTFAVVTHNQITLIDSGDLEYKELIETGYNGYGLCAISTGQNGATHLICPTYLAGGIRILPFCRMHDSFVIRAHDSDLMCLSISPDGQYFASASDRGTIIRVFSTLNGKLLHEFKRGLQPSTISSMVFRPDNSFLCLASTTNTVHIFKLGNISNEPDDSINHNKPLTQKAALLDDNDPDRTQNNHLRLTDINSNPTKPHQESDNSTKEQSTNLIPTSISWFSSSFFELQSLTDIIPKPLKNTFINARVSEPSILIDSLTSVVSKLGIHDRSFAQFHLSENHDELNMTAPYSRITGPICAFAAKDSTHIFLLHTNGTFYEIQFAPQISGKCYLLAATQWFSYRSDFSIKYDFEENATSQGFEQEWQILT